jgi:hypothetical protein
LLARRAGKSAALLTQCGISDLRGIAVRSNLTNLRTVIVGTPRKGRSDYERDVCEDAHSD